MCPDTERSGRVLDRQVKRLVKTISCGDDSQVVSDRGWQYVRERSPVADKETAKAPFERDVCASWMSTPWQIHTDASTNTQRQLAQFVIVELTVMCFNWRYHE